jgi:hypothetical protein
MLAYWHVYSQNNVEQEDAMTSVDSFDAMKQANNIPTHTH